METTEQGKKEVEEMAILLSKMDAIQKSNLMGVMTGIKIMLPQNGEEKQTRKTG